jgi:hypothetical protein
MPIGDDAVAAGFSLVPDNGAEGLVKQGAREINRTRDYVAQTKTTIPVGKAAYRTASGITSGTAAPSGGNDGDIYFQYEA